MIDFETRSNWNTGTPVTTYHFNRYVRDNQIFLGYFPTMFFASDNADISFPSNQWIKIPLQAQQSMLSPIDENRIWADGDIHFNLPGLYSIIAKIRCNIVTGSPFTELNNTVYKCAIINNESKLYCALREFSIKPGISNGTIDANLGNGLRRYITKTIRCMYLVRERQSISIQAYNNFSNDTVCSKADIMVQLLQKL